MLYPVGYASKKLSLTEAKYPIIEKESLAVVWGIRRFKLYLAGKRFTLQTDHKPLKYLKDAAYQNDHVFHWAMAVQEYSFCVEDIPGKENIGADFWSHTGYCKELSKGFFFDSQLKHTFFFQNLTKANIFSPQQSNTKQFFSPFMSFDLSPYLWNFHRDF